MAVITSLVKHNPRKVIRHRTNVECKYAVAEVDGRKLLQLDTYGSAERAIPGKVSQTIQLDEHAALMLWKLLRDEFGFSAN
jgi:hypothetical protein